MKKLNQLAFTLIEVIVSLAVIGLVLPVIFSIVFVLMNQQVKIQRLKTIKQEGDYILNHISNQIKNNAIGVAGTVADPLSKNYDSDSTFVSCANISSNDGTGFYIISKDKYVNTEFNNWFKYVLSADNKISSQSSTTTPVSDPVYLNSTNVKISQVSPAIPFISCKKDSTNDYSPPIISVNFRIEYKNQTASTRVEDNAFFNYQNSFKLRTY